MRAGRPLGLTGIAANVPHLHFAMGRSDADGTVGNGVDPTPFLRVTKGLTTAVTMDLAGKVIDEGLPFSGSLRLALGSVTHRGWQECRKPILAIVTDELQAVAPCTLSWKGRLFRGPREVVAQSRRLAAQFLGPGQLAELLRVGSRGEPVEHAERWLRRQGFDPGAVDGVFDDAMDAAVRAFQQAEGLEVDGVIGTDTWRALRR